MASTSASGQRAVAQSNNRRRGWVIASEDGTELERPNSFDARRSAAAWNKGKGPSQASIPSRASSLASPTPSPTIPSTPLFAPVETAAPSTTSQPVPPPRVPSSSMSHAREASGSSTEAESSSGRRRPSPPLLVPPKQTYRKAPSVKVLPPSAYSDHQKLMAAANKAPRPAFANLASSSSSSTAGPSGSRPPVALRSDLALLAASRRANSSSASSAATTSTATSTTSATTPASSVAMITPADNNAKGKGKQTAQSPLQRDEEGFFTSGRTVQQLVDSYNSVHRGSQQTAEKQTSQQQSMDRVQPKNSLLFSVHPLPALSEKSANSDLDDVLSSTSENVSDSEGTSVGGARPGMRRDSLRIELPPPPAQFKDRYPSILVDSTHASDSEASGTSNGAPRRRKRRSTASTSNRLGGDAEDDDDDDYADDDSSWPSTPSTTPLEMYFTAADARPRASKKAVQTTKEIIAPDPGALGMGRPMVVVTSPSTASEVSSDRRSSSGSGSASERTYSSSPPAAASVAPAPALSKIEEHPGSRVEAETAAPPRRSLSFELPAMPRSRASEEALPVAAPVRSPSRAKAFFAKISPSRSANRSSVDLASTARPDVSAVSVDLAKRMSLESQRRTSAEQRRSVELRPILLNAASRPSPRVTAADLPMAGPSSANSTATAQQAQQRRRSSGRMPIRPNVVPYHSRRSSEVSLGSSNESPMLQDRGSFDKEAFDPRYSPSSQVTTLTMPSPALGTDPKHLPHEATTGHPPVGKPDPRTSSSAAPKDRFAASMPSLHQPTRLQQAPSRRSPSHEEAEGRPSAIRLLVDSQKGRMTRDNDSIAEWISVSVNDLPLPGGTQAYGNGGAGEFSNEKQQAGKKLRKNRPWRLGRFAASEVVLPAKTASSSPAVQSKRRSVSLVKRASSVQVNESTRQSGDSGSSPHKGPFMRNLGFTTANRNVVLQNLCAERSISALAASTIFIAGSGRIQVPQPSPLPVLAAKAKPQEPKKPQVTKDKRQSKRLSKQAAAPVVEAPANLVNPRLSAEASRDAYLNVSEDRHTGYNLSGAAVGTVKSMVPETGDWSGSSGHDRHSSEEVGAAQPFRDYEDEGSDLFDSEESESESEDEMDYEDEDVEVPVRFGQRINLANRSAVAASPLPMRSSTEVSSVHDPGASQPTGQGEDSKVVRASVSLERLTPGTVMLHGSELRICVEEAAHSTRNATPLAYWKAVEVQQVKPQDASDTPQRAEGQVRRQPSSKAMMLEQEVATGIFAAFVGNRSPRRQSHRSGLDASSNGDRSSSQKPVGQPTEVKELLVSKVNESAFSVRSESRSTGTGEEQVVEITRRITGSHGITNATRLSSRESSQASVPTNKLERAFPSALLSNGDLAHGRSRSNRTDGSQASLEGDDSERVTMRIQRAGGRGFVASFQTRSGQQWTWHGSKLEASVMSPSTARAGKQALDALDGYDMSLRTSNGQETIELATYSTDSQVRNALGLFKPRTKAVPKALPEDEASIAPAVPPPAQVLPLAIPFRGIAGPMARAEPQIPRRGIRGGPLLRPQPIGAGSTARHHGLWQHQRAAISTEAVVQVHNNAVNNARASLQFDRPGASRASANEGDALGSRRSSADTARASSEQQRHETAGNKKMGELSFSTVEPLDRDLVVLSLLAVMGVAKI